MFLLKLLMNLISHIIFDKQCYLYLDILKVKLLDSHLFLWKNIKDLLMEYLFPNLNNNTFLSKYFASFFNALKAPIGDHVNLYPIGLKQNYGDGNPPHQLSNSKILLNQNYLPPDYLT